MRRLLPFLVPALLSAQQPDPRQVNPERPTVATHAWTVARGYAEIETGVQSDQYDGGLNGFGIPTVAKFGVARNAQLDLLLPLARAPGAAHLKAGDFGIAVKYRLADHQPVLGAFALQPSITFPTSSTQTAASLLLISSHQLGDIALDINAGVTRSFARGAMTSTLWTVSSGGVAVDAVGWVFEVFGYPGAGGPPTVSTLFGPTLSISPSLAVDAGLILPVAGRPPRSWYAGGVWNIGRLGRW